MIRGFVDVIRRDLITGWVADSEHPNRVFEVVLQVDGVERGQYLADQPRRDLQALNIYGDGNRGFRIALSPPLSSDEDHEVIVRPLTGWGPLRRGHFRIAKNSADGLGISDLEDEHRPSQSRGSGSPRYILHVGSHKTGTTYLQSAFFEIRAELRAGGVLYPDTPFGVDKIDVKSHADLPRALAAFDTATLTSAFEWMNASSYNTILISAEDLAAISRDSLRYLKSLIAGRPVDVVYYCRRWSELLPSLWQEDIKHGMTQGFADFVAAQLADPMRSRAINFDILLGRYAEAFGIENIKIVSYNHVIDAKLDLYDHFVRSILMWDKIPSVARATPNRSLDPVDIETVRLLNEIAIMRSEPIGIEIFNRYQRNRSDAHLPALRGAMERSLATIRLNDAALGLRAVHEFLFEKYGGCMVDPSSGYNLFSPAIRDVPTVQASYLLAEGAAQAAFGLYDEVSGPEPPAAA